MVDLQTTYELGHIGSQGSLPWTETSWIKKY